MNIVVLIISCLVLSGCIYMLYRARANFWRLRETRGGWIKWYCLSTVGLMTSFFFMAISVFNIVTGRTW